MAGRIALFGATGYTGCLTAEALVARGARPLLAGRSPERLGELAERLGGLETSVADVDRPDSVRALVERGDVLISTVGPFLRWGDPAIEAAIGAGAWYLDSTGDPGFIRRVFERYGPEAERTGAGLVTAFGYDFVPGNLAGALALREARERAVRIDVGYFLSGDPRGGISGGTRASLAGAMLEPHFAWRGSIKTERGAARVRSFVIEGRSRPAFSTGSSEHFTLPRLHPGLREVNSYLGWFGPATRALQVISAASAPVLRVPTVRSGLHGLAARFLRGSTGGPDVEARERTGSHVVAIASGEGGELLAEVHLAGVNGYDFTGRILAWGAARATQTGLHRAGALGPVEAFGLEELEAGCAEAGLERV
jgi:short subunit dehydrogenase-like uncharacterized protein